jgi:Uma2 family endonuclease
MTFEEKRQKFLPKVPRAIGKPTTYIEGYPTEDDKPMSATERHGYQITTLSYQMRHYFRDTTPAYVGTDSFVYYREGDRRKFVAPDVYVALGPPPRPLRRSFYTWAEGTAPTVVFEFLSDSTAKADRGEKLRRYFAEIGIHEYFIHQPDAERPFEFRGWRWREEAYEEISPDERGALYSEALNLYFWVEDIPDDKLRLMRPYLPDGTPIATYEELQAERKAAKAQTEVAKAQVEIAKARAEFAEERTEVAETRAEIAEVLAETNAHRIAELQEEMARFRELFEQRNRK